MEDGLGESGATVHQANTVGSRLDLTGGVRDACAQMNVMQLVHLRLVIIVIIVNNV